MSESTRLLDEKTRQELGRRFEVGMQAEVLIELVSDDHNPEFTRFSRQFIQELAELSPAIKVRMMAPAEFQDPVLSISNTPDIFLGRDQGYKIEYLGAPAGYEAQSLIESLIRLSRRDAGFSPDQQFLLDGLDQSVLLESFVTTSCPHCPRSSILNNRLAIAKPGLIHSRTIESQENSEISRQFDIQAVPQQLINREPSSKSIGVQSETSYILQVLQLGCRDYESRIREWKKQSGERLPDQPDGILHLNGDNFGSALEKYPLILLDFWAEWCQPCRMLGPVLEELAPEYRGRLVIAKINIDQDPDLAQPYQVESIPTVMLLKEGKPLEHWVGFRSKKEIRTLIDPYL